MAHPADCFFCHIGKQRWFCFHKYLCFSIFTHGSLLHPAAQYMHHKLCAVAKSQHGNAQFKKRLLISRSTGFITTVRSTCQNNSLRIHRLNLLQIRLVRIYLAVNIAFSDTPCNQLIVLPAKVNDDYLFPGKFIFHRKVPPDILYFAISLFLSCRCKLSPL